MMMPLTGAGAGWANIIVFDVPSLNARGFPCACATPKTAISIKRVKMRVTKRLDIGILLFDLKAYLAS
jgi:hypothetical protein